MGLFCVSSLHQTTFLRFGQIKSPQLFVSYLWRFYYRFIECDFETLFHVHVVWKKYLVTDGVLTLSLLQISNVHRCFHINGFIHKYVWVTYLIWVVGPSAKPLRFLTSNSLGKHTRNERFWCCSILVYAVPNHQWLYL